MMVGNNLKETQLQQIVDKTILLYDKVLTFISLQLSIYANLFELDHTSLWQGGREKFKLKR